jgi:hypothetical protein
MKWLRDVADVLKHARPTEVARLLVPALRPPAILNEQGRSGGAVSEIAGRLGALRPRLLAEAFAPDGGVDYARLRGSPLQGDLAGLAGELGGARFDLDGDDARTAFWINLYNVLTIHGVLALGVRRSVMEIPTFFGRAAYRVAGHVFVLDDIENGILRRNAPHPVTKRRMFRDGDPRAAFAPSRLDPRIHGALVCAARSCPPIAFYEPARLDEQLELAARSLAGATTVDAATHTLGVHLVFRWYRDDFGGDAGVRAFLKKYGTAEVADAIDRHWVIEPTRYDWALNDR